RRGLGVAVSTASRGLDLMKLIELRDEFGATFKKGDVIFASDQPAEQFFVLMRGRVQLDHQKLDSETVGPGDVFGEVEVFAEKSRASQATALDDCQALAFSRETAVKLAEATPSFALVVIRQISERLAQVESLLASSGAKAAAGPAAAAEAAAAVEEPKVPAGPVGP